MRPTTALLSAGLVTWTSGNVSGRDPETGLVAIKPSGVMFDDLTPDSMAVLTLDGEQVGGDLPPSSDTASHLFVYRGRPDVNGMTHTHSNYATAFAAAGRSIPVCLTGIADEFGCDIPLGGYAAIGGKEIRRGDPAVDRKLAGDSDAPARRVYDWPDCSQGTEGCGDG